MFSDFFGTNLKSFRLDGNTYVCKIAAPEATREDVEVTFSGNYLIVEVKETESYAKRVAYVIIPARANRKKTKAKVNNGMIVITMSDGNDDLKVDVE